MLFRWCASSTSCMMSEKIMSAYCSTDGILCSVSGVTQSGSELLDSACAGSPEEDDGLDRRWRAVRLRLPCPSRGSVCLGSNKEYDGLGRRSRAVATATLDLARFLFHGPTRCRGCDITRSLGENSTKLEPALLRGMDYLLKNPRTPGGETVYRITQYILHTVS